MANQGQRSRKQKIMRILRSPLGLAASLVLVCATGISAFAFDTTPGERA